MPLTIYYNWLSMHLCICHQIKPLVFAQVILANNPVQLQDLRARNCCDAKKCTWDNMKTFVQHNKTYCHFQLPIRCITKASGKLHTVQILTSNMDFFLLQQLYRHRGSTYYDVEQCTSMQRQQTDRRTSRSVVPTTVSK